MAWSGEYGRAFGHKAKLDTGEIVSYDACSEKSGRYADGWEFLGEGVVYEISDTKQRGNIKYFFWKRSGCKKPLSNQQEGQQKRLRNEK